MGLSTQGAPRQQVDALIERLSKAGTPAEKQGIAEQLGRVKAGAPHLVSRLATLPPAVQGYAMTGLLLMKDSSTPLLLRPLLSDRAAGVRALAARLVGLSLDSNHAPLLHPLLRDPEGEVRQTVATALERLGHRDSFVLLADLCEDADKRVREKVVAALAGLAVQHELHERHVEVLGRSLARASGESKLEIMGGLEKAHLKKEAAEALVPCLSDSLPEVRARAATALGGLSVAESAGPIVERLSVEREETVRVKLAVATQKMRTRGAVPHLIVWLREPEGPAFSAALQALRKISDVDHGTDPDKWAAWWVSTSAGARKP